MTKTTSSSDNDGNDDERKKKGRKKRISRRGSGINFNLLGIAVCVLSYEHYT